MVELEWGSLEKNDQRLSTLVYEGWIRKVGSNLNLYSALINRIQTDV